MMTKESANSAPSARVELALERFSEDEALTGELTDPAATALLQWIEQQVRLADAAPDDATFGRKVAAIRAAARSAARSGDDEALSPEAVVARAQSALDAGGTNDAHPISSAVAPAASGASTLSPTTPAPVAANDPVPSSPRRSTWHSLCGRVRRWLHRKA